MCSRTTESTPPERPAATRLPRSRSAASCAFAAAPALVAFLEAAIGHEPLEAFLDQLLRFLLLQLRERLGQRLLQRRGRRLRVAMRTAQRRGHDLVEQAERLEAVRGDA